MTIHIWHCRKTLLLWAIALWMQISDNVFELCRNNVDKQQVLKAFKRACQRTWNSVDFHLLHKMCHAAFAKVAIICRSIWKNTDDLFLLWQEYKWTSHYDWYFWCNVNIVEHNLKAILFLSAKLKMCPKLIHETSQNLIR